MLAVIKIRMLTLQVLDDVPIYFSTSVFIFLFFFCNAKNNNFLIYMKELKAANVDCIL